MFINFGFFPGPTALLVLSNGLGLNCHQGAVKQEGSVLKKYVSKSAHILFFLSFARVSIEVAHGPQGIFTDSGVSRRRSTEPKAVYAG